MKRLTGIIFLIFITRNAFSQIEVYIKPTLDAKSYFSSAYGQLHNSIFMFSDDFAKNPYFEVNNITMSFMNNYQVGLYAGVSLKNRKHLLEIGWNQYATGSKIQTSFMSYSN